MKVFTMSKNNVQILDVVVDLRQLLLHEKSVKSIQNNCICIPQSLCILTEFY